MSNLVNRLKETGYFPKKYSNLNRQCNKYIKKILNKEIKIDAKLLIQLSDLANGKDSELEDKIFRDKSLDIDEYLFSNKIDENPSEDIEIENINFEVTSYNSDITVDFNGNILDRVTISYICYTLKNSNKKYRVYFRNYLVASVPWTTEEAIELIGLWWTTRFYLIFNKNLSDGTKLYLKLEI